MVIRLFGKAKEPDGLDKVLISLQQLQATRDRLQTILAEQDAFDRKHKLGQYDPSNND
jgi:hypothetical protein